MGKLELVFRVRVHGAGAQNRESGRTEEQLMTSHPEKLKLRGTFLPHGGVAVLVTWLPALAGVREQ